MGGGRQRQHTLRASFQGLLPTEGTTVLGYTSVHLFCLGGRAREGVASRDGGEGLDVAATGAGMAIGGTSVVSAAEGTGVLSATKSKAVRLRLEKVREAAGTAPLAVAPAAGQRSSAAAMDISTGLLRFLTTTSVQVA